MSEYRTILDQARRLFPAPEMTLARVLRRRDRRKRNQRIGTAALALVLAAVAVAVIAHAFAGKRPVPAGPLLHHGEMLVSRGGSLVAVDSSTGRVHTLTLCPATCDGAELSPDGTRVAFVQNGGIYVMGSRERPRLVAPRKSGDTLMQFAWSPDGTRIAYDGGDDLNLRVVGADGTGEKLLASALPRCAGCPSGGPGLMAWSPDGTRIAYGNAGNEIDVIGADGTGKRTLASIPHPGVPSIDVAVGPLAWSPTGAGIAASVVVGGRVRLYVVDASNGRLTLLSDESCACGPRTPAWSPDGTTIAYVDQRLKTSSVVESEWVVSADGTSRKRLFVACGSGGADDPSWSPDGSRIAFVASCNGVPGHYPGYLYVVNADGSGLKKLAPALFRGETPPAWAPSPNRPS